MKERNSFLNTLIISSDVICHIILQLYAEKLDRKSYKEEELLPKINSTLRRNISKRKIKFSPPIH